MPITPTKPAELAGPMATALAQNVKESWERWIIDVSQKPRSERSEPYVQQNVWAGQFHPCLRAMIFQILVERPPWKPDRLASFRRGNDRERQLLSDLKILGRDGKPPFDIEGEQTRFALKDRKGRVVITGKVDTMLKFVGHQRAYPLEVKAWSPFLTERVETFEDLFSNPWTRRGAYQTLCYLYGAGEPIGFMLLDRSGLPKLLPVALMENWNAERVEEFLTLASKTKDYLEQIPRMPPGDMFLPNLPGFYHEASECKRCDFVGTHCNPPILSGAGAQIITDEETIEQVRILNATRELHLLHERADRYCKEHFKGIDMAVCGQFLIEGKHQKHTKTVWPNEETKKLYQVTDPKGSFKLTYTKIGFDKDESEES